MIQHLQAENQRLEQLVAQQQQALIQRAEPLAQAVLDTLNHWCELAAHPGHPAQPLAVDLLQKWVAVNRRAEAAASSIVVAQGLKRTG